MFFQSRGVPKQKISLNRLGKYRIQSTARARVRERFLSSSKNHRVISGPANPAKSFSSRPKCRTSSDGIATAHCHKPCVQKTVVSAHKTSDPGTTGGVARNSDETQTVLSEVWSPRAAFYPTGAVQINMTGNSPNIEISKQAPTDHWPYSAGHL